MATMDYLGPSLLEMLTDYAMYSGANKNKRPSGVGSLDTDISRNTNISTPNSEAGNYGYSTSGRVNRNVSGDMQKALTSAALKTGAKVGGVTLAGSLAGMPTGSALGMGLQMGLGPSAMAGVFGNVTSAAMGIPSNSWATGIAGALGGLALGPVGSILGGAFGNIGWDAIKDFADIRENEVARDALEDNSRLGYVGGRQTYRGIENALGAMGVRGDLTRSTNAFNTAMGASLVNQLGPELGQQAYNDYARMSAPVSVDTQFGNISMDVPSTYGMEIAGMEGLDSPMATVSGGPLGDVRSVADNLAGVSFGGNLTSNIGETAGVVGMSPSAVAGMEAAQAETKAAVSAANEAAGTPSNTNTQTASATNTNTSTGKTSTSSGSTGTNAGGSSANDGGFNSDSWGNTASWGSDIAGASPGFGGSDSTDDSSSDSGMDSGMSGVDSGGGYSDGGGGGMSDSDSDW